MATADVETGTVFQPGGTLAPPGPVGRIVRMAFAYGCWQWLSQIYLVNSTSVLENMWVIGFTAFAVHLSRYTVNIGLGWRTGNLPRVAALALLAGAVGWGYSQQGEWLNEPLLQAVRWLNIYVFAHLGVSFALSGVLATPGCEMRAIPILLGRLVGKMAKDHHCPGPIRQIDAWETKMRANGKS